MVEVGEGWWRSSQPPPSSTILHRPPQPPMAHWIVKTEPSTYSYDDLARQKTAVWDGVKNNLALKHLGQMRPGDRVLVYHTGDEKAVVGIAEVVSQPYPDPKQKDAKLTVVD